MEDFLTFIVATKDRPSELRRMLRSIEIQSYRPNSIILVDAGEKTVETISKEFTNLSITYLKVSIPSAAKQRNVGIEFVSKETTFIGFIDDDAALELNAIETMMNFLKSAPEEIVGASFNMMNCPPQGFFSKFNILFPFNSLGLYSTEKGRVNSSGFATLTCNFKENTFVEWLPSGGVIWRKKVLDEFKFDEWFDSYSYLEDLDFSYRVSKKYKLIVVADAKYYHYPAESGRGNEYEIGRKEVINRLYFIKKYPELSLFKCFLMLIIRVFYSLFLGVLKFKKTYFQRAFGIVGGLFSLYADKKYSIIFSHFGCDMPVWLRVLRHNKNFVRLVKFFLLRKQARKIYLQLVFPRDNKIKISLLNFSAEFYVRSPEMLRIVETALLLKRHGEIGVLKRMLKIINPGDIIYDIGAFIGTHALFLALKTGEKGRVYAFEPEKDNFEELQENIALNHLKNITAIKVALGNHVGEDVIFGSLDLSSLMQQKNDKCTQKVTIVSGDAFIQSHNLPFPNVVKIDVEGYEYYVIKGLKETLMQDRCRMVFCEMHPTLLPEGVKVEDCIELLKSFGFNKVETYLRGETIQAFFFKSKN